MTDNLLRLSFEPEAIIQHFDGKEAGTELREALSDNGEAFITACDEAVNSDALYNLFHRLCVDIYETTTGKEYTST